MSAAREYIGPFPPLPEHVREAFPELIGWRFLKAHPEPGRWEPSGYQVIMPDGIMELTLDGLPVVDSIIYA